MKKCVDDIRTLFSSLLILDIVCPYDNHTENKRRTKAAVTTYANSIRFDDNGIFFIHSFIHSVSFRSDDTRTEGNLTSKLLRKEKVEILFFLLFSFTDYEVRAV